MLKRALGVALGMVLLVGAPVADADTVNVFDEDSGTNTYFGGLGSFNWVPSFGGLLPNAGSEFFASAFTNADGFGLTKDLGDTVEDTTYLVSFVIASYADNPIDFSDFVTLNIGAQGGTTVWTSTPAISAQDTWFLWEGQYTPTPGEIGSPFVFEFQFGPTGLYDVAIDGPVAAVPEPTPLSLVGMALTGMALARRRKR